MEKTEFWDDAFRSNASVLRGVLRRYVADNDLAQDLLQDVFIQAIKKYDSFSHKGSFEGWLHRIAVNSALMYLRNEKSKMVPLDIMQVVTDTPENEPEAEDVRGMIEAASFSSEELLAAIDHLPAHHKMVFNMYVMDGFTHQQIGKELDISPGTSKSHLARARKKIQQYLYDEALNKKRQKNKWRAAMLLALPAKTHFIDKLFQTEMSDFSLPGSGDTSFLQSAMQQTATTAQNAASVAQPATSITSQVATQAVFWGNKLSYVAVCCGTAAITSSVCWVGMSENSPINQDQFPETNMIMHTPASTDTTRTFVIPAPSTTSETAGTEAEEPSVLPSGEPETILPENHTAHEVTPTVNSMAISPVHETAPTANKKEEQDDDATLPGNNAAPGNKATSQHSKLPNNKTLPSGKSASPVTNASPTTIEKGADKEPPIIVTKQIIEHKTVVVRDTIIIEE